MLQLHPRFCKHFVGLPRCHSLRVCAHHSQEAFAERAGISYKVYQSFEADRRWNLEMKTVFKLAAIHGLSLSKFFAATAPKTKLQRR